VKQQVRPQTFIVNQSMITTFEHHALFYVKSIQVEHSGELGREHRKRDRDIADWGERERT
jgi:hypothetical protein